MARRGVDISGDGDGRIDWTIAFNVMKQLSDGAQPFAIIKVTEGTDFVDSRGAYNIQNAKTAGFEVAAYHFGDANQDGGLQGESFGRQVIPWLDLLGVTMSDGSSVKAFYDLEDDSKRNSYWANIGLETRILRVGHCLSAMDAVCSGLTGVYTSPGWFNDLFPEVDWSGRKLWGAEPGAENPITCGLWQHVSVWQYSWSGSLGNGSTGTDLDVIL